MDCRYCSKTCINNNSLRNHERLCRDNPDRQESPFTKSGKITPWNKGLTKESDPRVAEGGRKISEKLKGRSSTVVWTEEMRKRKSEWRKRFHELDPDSHPNRKLAGNRKKMSYPERVAFDFLKSHGISFEHNKKIGRFYPDFVIGTLIIEIDGPYWHDPIKDGIRDKELEKIGYEVQRICVTENIEERLTSLLLET